jgi:hypothetical protein
MLSPLFSLHLARSALPPTFFELHQHLTFLVVQSGQSQQIRSLIECAFESLTFAPPPNCRVVPRQEHVGNLQVPELGWPRVLRKVQQPTRKRFVFDGFLIAHDPRHEPAYRIDEDKSRKLATRQDVVTY